MFCIKCGKENENYAKFCMDCGEKLLNNLEFSNNNLEVETKHTTSDNVEMKTTNTTLADSKAINKVLVRGIGKAGGFGGFLGTGMFGIVGGGIGGMLGAKLLPTDEVHDKLTLRKDLNSSKIIVFQVLSTIGKIIDVSKYSNHHTIAAKCGSGFGNMNPAVICVEFDEINDTQTCLYISGYAKEGLIKQNTAIKAIERLKARLNN